MDARGDLLCDTLTDRLFLEYNAFLARIRVVAAKKLEMELEMTKCNCNM